MPTKRKSYASRTGQNTRAATIIAAAMFKTVDFIEDQDGNRVRVWKSSEGNQFTNAQLRDCLANRVAVEAGEMLGTVPPAAIRYCVNKGFLIQRGAIYLVTFKAATALDLPMVFKGRFAGRRIPFASAS